MVSPRGSHVCGRAHAKPSRERRHVGGSGRESPRRTGGGSCDDRVRTG
jgi:hypothetical protein